MNWGKTAVIADKGFLAGLGLLIIGIPFSKAVTEIGIGAVILGWIIFRLTNHSFIRTELDSIKATAPLRKFWVKSGIGIPLAGFIFFCFVSLINTNYFYPESLRGIVKVLKYAFLYLSVADRVNTRARFNNLLMLILAVAVVISLNGLIQRFTDKDLIRHYPCHGQGSITSSLQNPNNFSGYLCLLIPVPVCLLFFYRVRDRIRKILLSLSVLTLATAMLWTNSKGAWISLIIALFFAFLVQVKDKKRLILFLGGMAVVIVLFIVANYNLGLWNMLEGSAKVRLNLWHTAVNMITAQPVTGRGINTFFVEYPFYRMDSGFGSGYAHNCYLQMAAEIGLMGLLMFVWMIVVLFNLGLKSLGLIQDNFDKVVLIGLLAGILAFFIHSMVDTDLYTLPLATLFWLYLGLTVSLLKISNVKERGV